MINEKKKEEEIKKLRVIWIKNESINALSSCSILLNLVNQRITYLFFFFFYKKNIYSINFSKVIKYWIKISIGGDGKMNLKIDDTDW